MPFLFKHNVNVALEKKDPSYFMISISSQNNAGWCTIVPWFRVNGKTNPVDAKMKPYSNSNGKVEDSPKVSSPTLNPNSHYIQHRQQVFVI